MLKHYKILPILVLLVAAMGCEKAPYVETTVNSDEQVFTLSIQSFSDEVIGGTRAATSSTSIDRGYVIFYNSSTGEYKGYESLEDKVVSQSGSTVSFEVGTDYSIEDKIIAVFNHDVDAELPTDFSVITSDNVDSYFPISSAYLAKIQEEMNSGEYSLGMPMSVNDFTDSDRAVREVYRSVARMELFIKDGLTIEHDSHTHSIGAENLEFAIVNAISVGSVGYTSLDPHVEGLQSDEECFDVTNTDFDYPYTLTEYTGSTADDTKNKVYLHEFPYSTMSVEGIELSATTYSDDRFAIILKHDDYNIYTEEPSPEARYYKLNLLDKVSSTYFDVTRNHSYRILITAVNSRGYATLKEAYEMPPSNIEYEIYDDQGGLTLSNGQYAISMDEVLSYDEIYVYGDAETTLEFNNICYVLPNGGQMDGATFETNEVYFEIFDDLIVPDPPAESWDETVPFVVTSESDFEFVDNKSVLTADGQSIKVTLNGSGECTIALRIKLGNLDVGRDEIKITKVATNGDGSGVFDAHPGQITFDDHELIAGSWQSQDLDFGARASSSQYEGEEDGGTMVYMGENATPTGYRTMDGFVSGQYSVNSYPVFSPKTRNGYYSYKDSDGETRMVMIQLDQLAPFYLGHFGSAVTNTSSTHYYGGLICEKIEEVENVQSWDGKVLSENNGVMQWSVARKQYFQGTIYGVVDEIIGARYQNLVEGRSITQNIVENNMTGDLPTAARYCYMKNDVNGNGVIDSDEKIVWYLPAQNQLLAMWINMQVFETDYTYRLNNRTALEGGDARPYYWASSEVDNVTDYSTTTPSDFTTYAIGFNMLEGQSEYVYKDNTDQSGQAHVRCVRDLD